MANNNNAGIKATNAYNAVTPIAANGPRIDNGTKKPTITVIKEVNNMIFFSALSIWFIVANAPSRANINGIIENNPTNPNNPIPPVAA